MSLQNDGIRTGRVLFVDDEPAMLSSLRRIFRKEGYEVETAADGNSGLEVFRRFRPAVVVTDHRMPGMTGVEFLSKVRAIDPESVRVVLTGCTDLQSAEEAINQGEVWRFVTKPWDDIDLRQTVAAANERYRVVAENRLMLDKLASIGLLAGGVAHELAGPLTRILALAGLVASEAPAGSTMASDLREIENATMRAKTIVTDLLDFARTSKPADRRPLQMSEIANKSIALSRFQLHGIEVNVEPCSGGLVMGDANRLQQVVLNLISNAVDAIGQSRRDGKGGGSVTIRTWEEGNEVRLSVSDDGNGIAPDAQARVFDSFYTTKAPGRGTGLGLPVSLGIAREHGGRLEVTSTSGEGTTFLLSLPGISETETAVVH
jgi:two-component system, response regulator PhcR